jgi:hypothetical protein
MSLSFYIVLVVVGAALFLISWLLIRRARKKRADLSIQKTKTYPGYKKTATSEVIYPEITEYDKELYKKFLSEYDDGTRTFPNVNYRKGAANTCPFGLAEGFRTDEKGNMIWGYVRLHSGVDRAGGAEYKGIRDVVICPFNFDRSAITDYGDTGYGALIQLFQNEYQFEMRIAHMNPKRDIISWTLEQIKKAKPIKRDWFFGKAGTYGDSSGEHTHTEFLSIDERCEVFELLLQDLFADKLFKEYTSSQILSFYRTQSHFVKATDAVCLDDWAQIKKIKKIIFANKYLCRFIDWDGKNRTRYASNYLFNGL